ncbi:MAG: hypothetical protein M3680_10285 [Myxococcota bacterium]|nr:hypothetical protein [Myxococcota bacterium]
MSACELAPAPTRAPLVDRQQRPAVGNIGQTGRPRPGAIATPRVDPLRHLPHASSAGFRNPPAGQIAPTPAVPEAIAAPAPALQLSTGATTPLVNRAGRPAVGNIARKCSPRCDEVEEVVEVVTAGTTP